MGNFLDVKISFTNHDRLKKTAGLFAGLGHMQALLLATTNANYLLDRFCMERCCSSEYISRIVTSLIFMEILATFIVACFGVYIACTYSSKWQETGQLNDWNEHKEWYIGRVSTGIQFVIFLCYFQILYAFTYGGKKGHMHWFYVSLLIQQFVCLLIGGAIGFWEGGVTLWYLMAIPMGPIPVFFYQLMVHSWIRNNGPRDVEYIIVEYQIWLAITISFIATILWAAGYLISYIPIELEIQNLDSTPTTTDVNRINGDGTAKTLALTSGQVTKESGSLSIGSVTDVTAGVTLTAYSATLITATIDSGSNKALTLTVKAALTIKFDKTAVTVQSATKTGQPTLKYTGSSKDINSVTPVIDVKKPDENSKEVTLSLAIEEIKGTIPSSDNITNVIATIPVKIIVKDGVSPQPVTVIITSIEIKLPVPAQSTTTGNVNLTVNRPQYQSRAGTNTLTIEVVTAAQAAGEAGAAKANAVQVPGTAFYPKKDHYCFYSIRGGTTSAKKDIWANIGGKCEYVACYYRTGGGKTQALLILYILGGGILERKYFGTENAGNSDPWKEISEAKFIEKLPTLASGELTGLGTKVTTQYNRDFSHVLGPPSNPSATWAPLVMHGLAVGSFGSIFPNLIPKTLTCARTSRTLTVWSIFLSPLPHIFNLALAEYGNNPASCAWTESLGWFWQISWSLYIIYGLAFLFAIFNVHSPEWKLCCYIRSHGWMPLMMTLSITLITEIFIAIARAGIMMQKPANAPTKKLNHPLLWNKMACLMSLSYLPFWLTTTPMMKSYVSSLDPFLCDKDRDHWPTARYGRLRSFGYWCKCGLRGLYNSPRKLVTLNMRKALTRKDPPLYFLVTHDFGVLLIMVLYGLSLHNETSQSPLILLERVYATELFTRQASMFHL